MALRAIQRHTDIADSSNSTCANDNSQPRPVTHLCSFALLLHLLSQPIVTGTSVLAVRYKDGVMMMADTLGTANTYCCFSVSPLPLHSRSNPLHLADPCCSTTRPFMSALQALTAAWPCSSPCPRIQSINSHTLLGAGGEYSDFQHIVDLLAQLVKADFTYADGANLSRARSTRTSRASCTTRRSKVDPLWNTLLVAGVDFLAAWTSTAQL